MPGRTPELGTTYICGTHNLQVKEGAGVAPLEHKGGNAGRECGCQVYIETVRRKVTRAEVLAALAGEEAGVQDCCATHGDLRPEVPNA